VTIPDAKFQQVEFRAFGSYNFRILNFEVFFKEFVGTDPHLILDEIQGTLRGKLVDRFTEIVAEMAENDFSFVQMQANKSEFVAALMPRIKDYFTQFGLELTDFSIQGIDLPEELRAQAGGLETLYAVHNAEGEQLALVRDRALAFVLARQNNMQPVAVH